MTALCIQTDTEAPQRKVRVPAPSETEVNWLVLTVPRMAGAEYLTADVVEALWREVDTAFGMELAECGRALDLAEVLHHAAQAFAIHLNPTPSNQRQPVGRGGGNVFREFGARGGSQASQPLRTSRTALGMLNPSACTTFRMREKLALSYSVAS